MISFGTGPGGCGNCGGRLERLDTINRLDSKLASTLVICDGCGIVVGKGDTAETMMREEIAAGRGRQIDAAPGFLAMRLVGGPST